MKGYEAVAAAIAAEGCDTMFGVMGDANMMFWAILGSRPGFGIFPAWHEAAAVSMADGYARATGRVGVATVTNGPGLTHVSTSLIAAARHRVPLVLIAGDIAAGDRYNIQKIDQRRFAEACEAPFRQVNGPDDIGTAMREAFFMAAVHRRPHVVNIPTDAQFADLTGEWSYSPSRDFLPLRAEAPDPAALSMLADALQDSERPVLLAGRGALESGARDAIVRIAERVGGVLATSLVAKGLFDGEPYNVGISGGYASGVGRRLLEQADLVVAFGAELGHYTAGDYRPLYGNASLVRVDVRPAPDELGAVPPALHIQGDARRTAEALVQELDRRNVRRPGYRTAETEAALGSAATGSETPRPNDGLDPRLLMTELSTALPDNAQITSGGGHFWPFVIQYLSMPHGGAIEFSIAFGTIGTTLPHAIGIAIGQPKRPQVVIEGDGSLMQHMQEMETVVRLGLQMVLIVMNDAGYGAEVHKLRARGHNPALAQWTSPDFVAVTRALGGDGVVLEREADIAVAVEEGLRRGGLFTIDARLSPTTVNDRFNKLFFDRETHSPLLP